MVNALQPERCALLLRALADPVRLRLVRVLFRGPACVTALATTLALGIQDASHHLAILRQGGIVASEKRGRFVFYQLAPAVRSSLRSDANCERLDLGCCCLAWPRQGQVPRETD